MWAIISRSGGEKRTARTAFQRDDGIVNLAQAVSALIDLDLVMFEAIHDHVHKKESRINDGGGCFLSGFFLELAGSDQQGFATRADDIDRVEPR